MGRIFWSFFRAIFSISTDLPFWIFINLIVNTRINVFDDPSPTHTEAPFEERYARIFHPLENEVPFLISTSVQKKRKEKKRKKESKEAKKKLSTLVLITI